MGRRVNRNRVRRGINLKLTAQPHNRRKPLGEPHRVEMANIEEDVREPGSANLLNDATTHNVARGQFSVVVVLGHESMAVPVDEFATLAADSFGNKCAGGTGDIKRRRMKLHHLHVFEHRARPPGHCVAIARGDFGVCGFTIEHARAAGGQNGLFSPDNALSAFNERYYAEATVVVIGIGEKINRHAVLDDGDVLALANRADEGIGKFLARGVAEGVKNACG